MLIPSLREGRILALVVGDGIREEVQRLSETINRSATRAFAFGIVEIARYDMAGLQQVLVPLRLLAKAELLTRQVVVAYGAHADQRRGNHDEKRQPWRVMVAPKSERCKPPETGVACRAAKRRSVPEETFQVGFASPPSGAK